MARREGCRAPTASARPAMTMGTVAIGGEYRGVRAFTAQRPLTMFLILTFGIGWVILAVPVLAHYGVLLGADIPVEVYALGTTLPVLLPSALWVTSVLDGREARRSPYGRSCHRRVVTIHRRHRGRTVHAATGGRRFIRKPATRAEELPAQVARGTTISRPQPIRPEPNRNRRA